MSGHTWKLIDWFRDNRGRSQTRLAINSNLGPQVDVYRLLDSTEGLDVEIYTSMEAVGKQAEYIRDGLDYALWRQNVLALLDAGITVHVMSTINALCLSTLPQLLNELVEWKKTYGREKINFTLNILRFPSFQSPLVLPAYLREIFQSSLINWLVDHRGHSYLHEHEINHTQRLIDYLDVVKTPHSDAFEMPKLHNDFRQFYTQYDQRRNKNFAEYFPELKSWYDSIQI
jgi:hypothetical protein